MMYSPVNASECLIHAYDSWQSALEIGRGVAEPDMEKFQRCVGYARRKLEMAVGMVEAYPKQRGAKSAIAEAKAMAYELDRLMVWAEGQAA